MVNGVKRFLMKTRAHGVTGTWRIIARALKQAAMEVSWGARPQDKLALLVRWLLVPFYTIIRGEFPYAEFYPFNIMLRTPSGALFYCRRGTGDVFALTFDQGQDREGFRLDINRFLPPEGGVFVDVGANVGKYTVEVARRIGREGVVVALEPNPDVYRRLLFNLALNGLRNVIPLNVAADECERRVTLWVNPVYHGHSSLHMPSGRDDRAWALKAVAVEVDARPLDDILDELGLRERVRLVKIDVEGHEFSVLIGSHRLIRDQRPTIVFEAWDEARLEAIRRLLDKFGYEVRALGDYNFVAEPRKEADGTDR